ncbi:MAG: hypothetical protein M3024_13050 [Candidatus Dormibacteraeota bacterium]|nr:hypothetical protein [Candidatus Dormibacteraeota bacterium]
MSDSGSAEALARHLLETLEAADSSEFDEDTGRRLFAAAVRAYAGRWRPGAPPPFTPGSLTTDEVVVTAAEMLRAADVTTFEVAAMFGV